MALLGTGQLTLSDMNDVIASSTQPSSPIDGTLWWNTTELKLYVYSAITGWKFAGDGLEYGGVNLFTKSANISNYSLGSDGGSPITSSLISDTDGSYHNITWTTAGNYYFYPTSNTTRKQNETYTISLEIKTTAEYGFYWYPSENIVINKGATGCIPNTNGKWKRWSYTYTQTGVDSTGSKLFGFHGALAGAVISIRKIKLEKGDLATDWSPAPEDTQTQIDSINTTLGNMANDNLIDYSERQTIKDRLTEIIGFVIDDTTTTLPTTSTLDGSSKGNFYMYRKRALNAGISSSDTGVAYGSTTYGAVYDNVATKYNALKSYLEGLTPIDVWDLRTATQSTNITVVKSDFRTKWMEYYQACEDLAEATSKKLKENVDNVTVGGTNYVSNGDFAFDISTSLWKSYYTGQTKEVVDISTETPPHKYAYHVKNTTNANGGIFTPSIWSGSISNSLLNKEITISFWLKYQNILQGSSSNQLGRFGELVIEGETSSGTKVSETNIELTK